MIIFLVNDFTYIEKNIIKRFAKKHNIKRYLIYSLNKNDVKKGAKYLSLNKKYLKIQDKAFNLLDMRQKEVEEIAEILSNIMDLNLRVFVKRLLLNKVFYKEAQILIGEEILLKENRIKNVIILNKYKGILTNKDNVIDYFNSLDAILFLKAIIKYIAKLLFLLLRMIKNRKATKLIKQGEYDIIAIQNIPLGYFLVEQTLKLLKNNYSIAITSGFACNKEQILFKVQEGIDKIKIYPKIEIIDFLEIIKFFRLLKFKKYKYEIVSIFDNILFRKKICEYVAKKIKPKIILVKNEYDIFENIEYVVFNKYGIKYIDYMHGEKLYNITDSFLQYHKMAVWGGYYKMLLEDKLRAKLGMIEVIGNQLFDKIPSYCVEDVNLLKLKNKYVKIISVFTQRSYRVRSVEAQSVAIQKIVDFMKQRKNIFMILKHHPLEFKYPTPPYNLLIKSIKDRVLECTNENKLYDILSISDLVITHSSTVGLEAILFKKPVLYMNFGEVPNIMEYPKVNAAVEINDPKDSEFYLNKMLFDKKFIASFNYEKIVQNWANGVNGESYIKMKELIEKAILYYKI